jgi:hypothetical protein
MQICEICGKMTDDYSTCDSCEAIYCINHIANNICPICKYNHTTEQQLQLCLDIIPPIHITNDTEMVKAVIKLIESMGYVVKTPVEWAIKVLD